MGANEATAAIKIARIELFYPGDHDLHDVLTDVRTSNEKSIVHDFTA